MNLLRLLLIKIFLLICVNSYANSNWYQPMMGFSGSKVRVVQTSYYDDQSQKKHIYALHFKIDDGWKVYGKDSLGIGIAPSFKLSGNSQNVKNYNFYWPNPKRVSQTIGDEVFEFDIYENEVAIPFDLYGDLKDGDQVTLDLSYGVCNEICVPVNNKITFTIKKVVDEESFAIISKYLTDFDISIASSEVDFAQNDYSKEIKMHTLFYFIFAAFLGGLILNIMPCVLPVLSIKLISILKNRKHNHNVAKLSFFYTICGIMASFLLLAIIAAVISLSGDVFNWGVQFQSPLFLSLLIVIFAIYIANILGYFNFATSYQFSNFLNKKIDSSNAKKRLFLSNFFSGILAVLLATPCSAPFLGTAISFSVIQPAIYSFVIFLVMGVGFAFPYVILIIYPKAINYMPKSGHWMITFKNILAIFVVITAIWLCYVLAGNSSNEIGISVLIMSILLVLTFKIRFKSIRTIALAALVITIFATAVSDDYSEKKDNFHKLDNSDVWQYFERYEIEKFVADGKVVVVDVTADWCLTCKFNKLRVLEDDEVVKILKAKNVIAMRADITMPNKVVMDFINSYSRYAIPFNIVFGPNAKDGILLSELLNKEEFIATIKKASK